MENTVIKTRKIKIYVKENKNNIYSYLRKMSSDLCGIGNKVIRLHVNNQFMIDEIAKENNITKGNAKKIFEEKLGTSVRNSGYQSLTELPTISSNIRTSFNSLIFKKIQSDFFEISTNKKSIPSFIKTNMTIPFQFGDNSFKIDDDGHYFFYLPSTKQIKDDIGELKLHLMFGRDRSNNKIIVDRIISNEYTLCDSSIQVKDNEFFLLLTYKHQIAENKLDPNKVMGIDMGINRAVTFYITDEKRQPQQLDSLALNIQHERIKLSKQRQSIQSGIVYSHGGHGSKRKLQALKSFKEKEKNWYKNKNHQISNAIIKLALEYGVGTIKMEDLSGISKNKNDYYFKSWSYYQLQQFIDYKAKAEGINIIWVNPRNTSITCPVCGNVNTLNRSKTDVKNFSCTNNQCEDYLIIKDADVVASINIAKSDGNPNKGNTKQTRKEKFIKNSIVV